MIEIPDLGYYVITEDVEVELNKWTADRFIDAGAKEVLKQKVSADHK